MKLLSYSLLFFLCSYSFSCFAQDTVVVHLSDTLRPSMITYMTITPKTIKLKIQTRTQYLPLTYWSKKNILGFDISQIAFVNWNAGGASSISGLLKGNFHRNYSRGNLNWSNELLFRYGINKQQEENIRKTDDAFQINSTFGYRTEENSNWFHSAKFNFNTQFTNGFAYPNTRRAISKPFAPAYIFMGVGAENINKEKNRIFYISPFTFKTTLVLDQTLANQGAFGVDKAVFDINNNLLSEGKQSRMELGFLFTSKFKKEIFKNIIFENRLSLYSDYINRFGNIDVDTELQFALVVNQYVKANIGAQIIYDDDIKSKKEIAGVQVTQGPKAQIRQAISIGIEYVF